MLISANAYLREQETKQGGGEIDPKNPLAKPRIPYEILFAIGGWSAGSPTNFVETYDTRYLSDQVSLRVASDALSIRERSRSGRDSGPVMWTLELTDGFYQWTRTPHRGLTTVYALWTISSTWSAASTVINISTRSGVTIQWRRSGEREPACITRGVMSAFAPTVRFSRLCPVIPPSRQQTSPFSPSRYLLFASPIVCFHTHPPFFKRNASEFHPPLTFVSLCFPIENFPPFNKNTRLGGKIYALGGYNGRTRMSSGERYEPQRNQWEMIPPMHRQRSDASAAALQDKIYIVGGFNGREVLNTAEVFDVETNQWSYIHSMIHPRSGVSLVAFRDSLYALGGFDGFSRLSSGNYFLKWNKQNFSYRVVEWSLWKIFEKSVIIYVLIVKFFSALECSVGANGIRT